MVEVYRELYTNLSCDVAIEVLLATLAQDRVDWLERKAKVLAAMNRSDIATIYGLNITPADARATGEEEANEPKPMDNFVTRSGSLDPS
jgi:hypothetical protein